MNIQEQVAEFNSLLALHSGYVKQIRQYIELIQQLHTTPKNYLAAVSEVVRRRSYSQAFLMVNFNEFSSLYIIVELSKSISK